jgi:hypothetical protein
MPPDLDPRSAPALAMPSLMHESGDRSAPEILAAASRGKHRSGELRALPSTDIPQRRVPYPGRSHPTQYPMPWLSDFLRTILQLSPCSSCRCSSSTTFGSYRRCSASTCCPRTVDLHFAQPVRTSISAVDGTGSLLPLAPLFPFRFHR